MTDLVSRLRTENSMMGYYESPAIQIEAADEIERLREALEYLLSEVEGSSADVDPCAVRDSRAALHRTKGG